VFTSSVQPVLTSSAQPASVTSSSAAASSIQQIEQCDTTKSIVPFTVVSNGYRKYDLSKPITFPCNKDGFDMDLDIETTDDLYLMLSDKKVYSLTDKVVEISFNFKDKIYKITERVVGSASGGSQSSGGSRAFNGRIRISYTGSDLNIYINNEGEPFYKIANKTFKALYFAPNSGKVDVTFGYMFCYGQAECDASTAPATIEPTSALPTLTSSAQSVFTSSVQPVLTSSAQPAPVTSSSAAASSIQQIEQCDTTKSIVPFTVVSNGYRKYDLSKPITLPCNKDGFDMDLDIETTDDLYLMLSDKKVYSLTDKVVEISFNFKDKIYKIAEGVVGSASGGSQSSGSSRAFNGRIRISYVGSYLNIYINNEGEPFYQVENRSFKALYFAPNSGKVDVTFGYMFCYGQAECDASTAPATIEPTSALPTLTSSAQSVFTSSVQPVLTSSAQPASVTSSSAAASSIQQIEQCDTTKSIVPFTVVSNGYRKYDLSKPITFPCNKDGFDMDLDIETTDDLYLMLSDKKVYSLTDKVVEISFNFKDKIYKIAEGVVGSASGGSQSSGSSRAFNGRIRISYVGSYLNIYINNEGEPFYQVENRSFKALYFAPNSGKVDVTFGYMFCFGEAECDASAAPATIEPTSALPTLTSSAQPVFTSSVQPVLTSSAQPAPVTSSSAAASSIQQIEQCDTTKSIVPFTVVSNGYRKYDLSKPITFPCNKDGFDMDLDIETTDDLYLMLSDKKVYSLTDKVVEISFNFKDKIYKIAEGVVGSASGGSQSSGSSRAFNGRIRISYVGSYLNIYINNEGEPFYQVENRSFKALYFAPNSGKVDVTFGYMFCFGEAECDASAAPATIEPTSALPTLTSSAQPVFTSSVQPVLTSSAQPAPVTSSSAAASSIQQIEQCDTTKSIVPFTVVSNGYRKYDLSKP
ncbi:hypothetical protein AYI70_g11446, partial [Smittium culicis]